MKLHFALCALAAALPALAQTAAPVAVEVTAPRRGDIHRFVTLPATLRANQSVTLHAKVPGYLKSITVDRGDTVKAGQLLAELEFPELLAARSRLEAEAAIAKIESDRLGAARAKAPDLVTPQAADAASARLAIAQAALKENETMLGYAKITAPFAGVVTARNVDVGAFVPAATANASTGAAAIVTVMDFATVRVRVAVPEVEAARVKTGQPVVVTTDALPGKTFRGTVTRHAGALDESTRSLLVEADLPNADGALRPGMYLSARIGVELHTDTMLIPAAALVREKAAGFVFTLTDGRATKLPVKYGFIDSTSAEILDGLAANTRVIIPGKVALAPGQAVTEAK
jgi:membrane fusion protein (multidrug efflux system)